MKNLIICLSLITSSLVDANSSYENIAQESWNKTFATVSCAKELVSKCVKNSVAVMCETSPAPYSGDGDCYELLEVLTFLPAESSESGEVEVLGKAQPTW